MANLPESVEWADGIYQLETTDPVLGGPDGIDNLQAKQLAARTRWLRALLERLAEEKAPLDSPALTGTPTVPTWDAGANDMRIANTAFVQLAIAALVNSSPAALDTLQELAAALGNDPNFATTMINALAGKQPLDPTLTALAGLATAANQLIYATGADQLATSAFPTFAREWIAAASDAGAARSKLALGSAALLTATTSTSDRTAGRAVRMGDLGFGQMTGAVSEVNFNLLPTNYPYSGRLPLLFGGVSATNSPKVGEYFWYVDQSIRMATDGTASVLQVAFPYRATVDGYYFRSRYQNVWSGWEEIRTARQLAEVYAPLVSPAFSGTPTAPTAPAGTNSAQIATTAFVRAAIAGLVGSSPAALDTLNELAAALGNDPNFAATMTNALAGKQAAAPTLTALAGLATAANQMIYATGPGQFAMTASSAFGRALLAAADQAAARAALGAASVAHGHAIADITGLQAALDAAASGGFTQSFTPTGWRRLPNGHIRQWGTANPAYNGNVTHNLDITLPTTFPNGCLECGVSMQNAPWDAGLGHTGIRPISNSQVRIQTGGATTARPTVFWWAEGH